MSLRWYAFLCGFGSDVLFKIDHLRSISFFSQNAYHDWLTNEYISTWFLVSIYLLPVLHIRIILIFFTCRCNLFGNLVLLVYMFCSFYLILYIIRFYFNLSLTPFYYFDYYEHQYLTSVLFHIFFWLKMHFLDHLLECPIGLSLKVVQLRRLFDWTNMAAALPQFFGAARHPCVEVSGPPVCLVFRLWQRMRSSPINVPINCKIIQTGVCHFVTMSHEVGHKMAKPTNSTERMITMQLFFWSVEPRANVGISKYWQSTCTVHTQKEQTNKNKQTSLILETLYVAAAWIQLSLQTQNKRESYIIAYQYNDMHLGWWNGVF